MICLEMLLLSVACGGLSVVGFDLTTEAQSTLRG
jgi:hypothetical protein